MCSHFAANAVPTKLAAALRARGGVEVLDDGAKMEEVLTLAMVQANEALRNSPVDDSLSGTTAITVMIRKDSLIVANVAIRAPPLPPISATSCAFRRCRTTKRLSERTSGSE